MLVHKSGLHSHLLCHSHGSIVAIYETMDGGKVAGEGVGSLAG